MLWGEKKKLSPVFVCFNTFFMKSMLNFSRLLANSVDILCGSEADSLLFGKHLRNCSDLSDWSDADARAPNTRTTQHILYILWKKKNYKSIIQQLFWKNKGFHYYDLFWLLWFQKWKHSTLKFFKFFSQPYLNNKNYSVQ